MKGSPWNSIAESVQGLAPSQVLTLESARQSPCATCATSPCCTHLPLTTFQVTNLLELDHAAYLLNFDRIELGLSATGEWSAYYTYPCRFLDRESAGCTIHGTAAQPQICVHYNPYNCWYKRAFNSRDSEEFVRVDRARLQLLVDDIVFDDDRRIVSVPAWEDIVARMAAHEDQPGPVREDPDLADPMIDAWLGAPEAHAEEQVEARGFESLADPCSGCAAYCCTTLLFPQPLPTHVSNVDYLRFCLGFPGVELVVAEGTWSLAVKTRCRHLVDGRCSVFGEPERPLICTYYDATRCDYRAQFGVPRPRQSMRVRLEQYPALLAQMMFDDSGALLALPPFDLLRAGVEASATTEVAPQALPGREPVLLPMPTTRPV